MKHKRKLIAALLVAAIVAPLVTVLAIPPWEGYLPFLVQKKITQWTGIHLHDLPPDYSGLFHIWDKDGNIIEQGTYTNGRWDGVWIIHYHNGHTLVGEYRNGMQWNGICLMQYGKGWIASYRHGKEWTGCFLAYDKQTDQIRSKYLLDGVELSEDAYKSHFHIPKNDDCRGLTHFPDPSTSS